MVSTVHRSHSLPLITKAVDTTSTGYQTLWLCCWRRDISSFFAYKKLVSSSLKCLPSVHRVGDLLLYLHLHSAMWFPVRNTMASGYTVICPDTNFFGPITLVSNITNHLTPGVFVSEICAAHCDWSPLTSFTGTNKYSC